MPKLHELIAIEPEAKGKANKALNSLTGLFRDGQGRFLGQTRIYKPLEEKGEPLPAEHVELSTTVNAELTELWSVVAPYLDVTVQKEITNAATKADVVVKGHKVLEGLPAPALLNLESRLGELRNVLEAIPTNDPATKWVWDKDNEHWVGPDQVAYRTKKLPRTHVKYEATEEHPAQTEMYFEDIRTGEWTGTVFSGMWTATEKRKAIGRLDDLMRAVKQARQRANDVEASEEEIGKVIFSYILGEDKIPVASDSA